MPAARGEQRGATCGRAQPVAVGLHHAGDRARRMARGQCAPVGHDRRRDRPPGPRRRERQSSPLWRLVQIGEAGELGLEEQVDLPGRPMALLGDDQFGAVVHALHVALPLLHAARGISRISSKAISFGSRCFKIILVAVDEHHRCPRPARSCRIHAGRTVAAACPPGSPPRATAATAPAPGRPVPWRCAFRPWVIWLISSTRFSGFVPAAGRISCR